MIPIWIAFGDKSAHAFFLIFSGKRRFKEFTLQTNSFGQWRLEWSIHSFFRQHNWKKQSAIAHIIFKLILYIYIYSLLLDGKDMFAIFSANFNASSSNASSSTTLATKPNKTNIFEFYICVSIFSMKIPAFSNSSAPTISPVNTKKEEMFEF